MVIPLRQLLLSAPPEASRGAFLIYFGQITLFAVDDFGATGGAGGLDFGMAVGASAGEEAARFAEVKAFGMPFLRTFSWQRQAVFSIKIQFLRGEDKW